MQTKLLQHLRRMDVSTAATTNWNLIAGTDVAKTIQTKVPDTEDFVKPQLDEVVSTDSAILLSSGTDTSQPTCEFTIRVFPKFKIESLTAVCTSPKIELFSGAQCEYVETIYGERLEDGDECDDIDGYRYDIEIQKSGVTHLKLKLITSSNELCIYGIQLNVAPNPNGITTLLPNSINLDNVKEMLNNSNQKLSPSAEKCKMFLESYKNAMGSGVGLPGMGGGSVDLMQEFKKGIETKAADLKTESLHNSSSTQVIKNYIDARIKETESCILKRLDAIEQAQNSKLDRILRMVERIERNPI